MSASTSTAGRIAVLVPCLNEEAAIASVVQGMRASLPDATIYVYDNGSTDQTSERARAAGAVVRREPLRGKGNVVRRMFADIDADVYVLVDGDATYDASVAPTLVDRLVDEQLDMVNASRVSDQAAAYRAGHRLGNKVISGAVARIFGNRFRDILSGYRVFSRRFVKSFPALASGFEIETELTVHALGLRMPIAEIDTRYEERPAGSASKLQTYRDGFRILGTILRLAKEERPLLFFSIISALLGMIAIALSVPIFEEYSRSGLVPRFPTAILSTGIMILAFLSLACGFVLDTVTRGRYEMKRLHYLKEAAPVRANAGEKRQSRAV
ncbi:MAG TPA: glycosyltransferase family 2 protein [Polyangia bacterium]|jgi:glycosyltransferase involved in cell wall biosynthesis|nr:glycosyltransferase family 2 protein [Polyangia bacterium]